VRKVPGPIACLSLLVLVAGGVVACTPKSPAERVAAMRANYTAELNGFVIKSTPAADETAAPAEGAAPTEPAAGTAAGTATDEAVQELPVTSDVVLDIVIRNQNDTQLAGLTLDVSQAGADGAEKGHWRAGIDSSKIGRGPGTQVTYTLRGVDYQQGDGFHVEVRNPVPPADRGDYREFSAAS
jgi:hypothetical protein